MTGQKAPIQIMNKLGNCCSHVTVLKVETAQAELSQELSQRKKSPSFKSRSTRKTCSNFWWDNFDCEKENLKGSIHTTHGIAFQEKSEHSTSARSVDTITHSGKKSLKVKTQNLPLVKINLKSPPPKIPCDMVIQNEKRDGHFQKILALWKLERKIHSGEN